MSQKKIVKMTRWICDDPDIEEDIKFIVNRDTWKTKRSMRYITKSPKHVDITVIVEPAKSKEK